MIDHDFEKLQQVFLLEYRSISFVSTISGMPSHQDPEYRQLFHLVQLVQLALLDRFGLAILGPPMATPQEPSPPQRSRASRESTPP